MREHEEEHQPFRVMWRAAVLSQVITQLAEYPRRVQGISEASRSNSITWALLVCYN
jgi:hypothetical protein